MYKQTDFPTLDSERASLVVAFSNLAERFNLTIPPVDMESVLTSGDPVIDLWTIATFIEDIAIDETVSHPSWPTSNNAIVKFRRMDVKAAGPVEHYCLMVDYRVGSILDSLDGVIKPASVYGPALEWASYVSADGSHERDPIGTQADPKPGTIYTVLRGGETGWTIARKLKIDSADFKDHNDIKDMSDVIPENTQLHLPIPIVSTDRNIKYRVLEQPLDMHVAKDGGARKWAFGNAKTFKDVSPSGPTYPQGTNLTIVALAEVPITDDGKDITAAYWIDQLSLGNYQHTGRVSFAIGFNHSHLAEGHIERAKPVPAPKVQQRLAEAEVALQEAAVVVEESPPEEIEIPEVQEEQWKATYKPFFDNFEPVIYVANEQADIRDYEGLHSPRPLPRGKGIKIVGTFWYGGVEIARPFGVTSWYGVPLAQLTREDDPALYEYNIPLAERVSVPSGGGHLTPAERYWYIPFARMVSQYAKLKKLFTKK